METITDQDTTTDCQHGKAWDAYCGECVAAAWTSVEGQDGWKR